MNLRRVFALVLRQYYLIRGSFSRVLPLFVWSSIEIVQWGFITRYLNGVSANHFDFVPALLGAVLLWGFFTRVLHGIAMALLEDVWTRNFLNVFSTPLTALEYVGGIVATGVTTSFVSLVFMVLLGSAVFGLSIFAFGAALVPFVLGLFLCGISLGIAAGAMVLRYGPAAEWFVWPIPVILAPFVGVYYPLSTLPGWMRAVAYTLPPSYIFEGMRGIVEGRGVSGTLMLGSLALSLVYVAAGAWFFADTVRRATRSGLLARYSAESVS